MLGIIGGVGPESTIEYYQNIIALYRERQRDGSYPEFIINSVDLKKGLDFMAANNLTGMADYLLEGIGKLARAGANFGLISANTPILSSKRSVQVANSVDQYCRSVRSCQSAEVETARVARDAFHNGRNFLFQSFYSGRNRASRA